MSGQMQTKQSENLLYAASSKLSVRSMVLGIQNLNNIRSYYTAHSLLLV